MVLVGSAVIFVGSQCCERATLKRCSELGRRLVAGSW